MYTHAHTHKHIETEIPLARLLYWIVNIYTKNNNNNNTPLHFIKGTAVTGLSLCVCTAVRYIVLRIKLTEYTHKHTVWLYSPFIFY